MNCLRYGLAQAPRSFETIWINPSDVKLVNTTFRRRYSGRVVDGDWDLSVSPIEVHPKIKLVTGIFDSICPGGILGQLNG